MHENEPRLRQANGRSVRSIFPLADPFGFSAGRLIWWPQIGVGYFPVTAVITVYDRDYFDRFDRDAHTELVKALMRARVEFVEKHFRGPLIDIGIGSGAFIEARGNYRITYGFD